MQKILSLFESMDPINKDILTLVAIVIAGAAIAIYLFTRPDKTTDY